MFLSTWNRTNPYVTALGSARNVNTPKWFHSNKKVEEHRSRLPSDIPCGKPMTLKILSSWSWWYGLLVLMSSWRQWNIGSDVISSAKMQPIAQMSDIKRIFWFINACHIIVKVDKIASKYISKSVHSTKQEVFNMWFNCDVTLLKLRTHY